MNSFTTMSETWIVIASIVIALFFVLGLFKKKLWMWVIAGVIAVGILIAQPKQLKNMKDSVVEFFNEAIDPLKDNNYEEEAKELDDELDNIDNKLDDYLTN